MLEFQEGFFDQEVRDGFYLDSTMKTLWAAELEVLEKVAEVCDRHGLKWYAAYGTLLGAIRHEGFVPWDDDMDIWVKRPDYNILMQVLPKELPEGYSVRGPLTDEGYNQYHTCINSGNGICITKEWLEQFHGCPFTVGLDIFPLDYLPRDEEERELQERLVTMTGRIAQLAKNVGRGDYDSEDSEPEDKADEQHKATTQKESVIEEINLGIEYLEENCKLQIDHQLLEDENWYRVSSELWKWANYLAMMYGEEESDYLVEYLDYIQHNYKVYPKEWFADGYSATFENFMIPIPAGYDEILRYIYWDYLACVKKTGTHEYPYYARQLRQLREYVKDIQHRAQNVGLVSIDEIEVKEETKELLPEWLPLTTKADGSRKKVVLSANDPAVYARYGDKALDKLEEIFHTFERVKDSVLLWWRPQPVMKKILDEVSFELGERYQEILDRYKEAGWGICDETDNVDRAVEACDIYYGDMNAILQPFQNAGKPIVLTAVGSVETADENNVNKNNTERINEYRAFLSVTDYAEDADKIYFANTNYNALVVVDKETWTVIEHVPFAETAADVRNVHLQCVQLQNRIYFLPAGAPCMHAYDMESRTQKTYYFQKEMRMPQVLNKFQESWQYFSSGNQLYLLPCRGGQKLWTFLAQGDAPVQEDWWEIASEDVGLKHGVMNTDCFYTLIMNTNQLYITNVAEKTIENVSLPDKYVLHMTFDGQNFWYTMSGTPIVCWNQTQGVVDRYFIPYDFRNPYGRDIYTGICFAGEYLFLFSRFGKILYVLDQDKRELRELYHIDYERGYFFSYEVVPYFKRNGNSLICMLQNAGIVLIIDLESLEVKQSYEDFCMDKSIKGAVHESVHQILLDRKALLYEDKDDVNLEFVLQYCMEN